MGPLLHWMRRLLFRRICHLPLSLILMCSLLGRKLLLLLLLRLMLLRHSLLLRLRHLMLLLLHRHQSIRHSWRRCGNQHRLLLLRNKPGSSLRSGRVVDALWRDGGNDGRLRFASGGDDVEEDENKPSYCCKGGQDSTGEERWALIGSPDNNTVYAQDV